MVGPIEADFPGLGISDFRVTSPATCDYNCIAWGTGDSARWWWPDPENDAAHWPAGIAMEETIEAFVAALGTAGFVPWPGEDLEPGFEKVALFANGKIPTHAARQMPNGRWTSKLGMSEDIEHDLHAVSGDVYGAITLMLRRPRNGTGR